MNINQLFASVQPLDRLSLISACGGGGSKGPSAAEQKAQEDAARARAQAEADKVRATQELERQRQSEKTLADQVEMANADQARRSKNRTLLAGVAAEEDEDVTGIDPLTGAPKKKKGTLIGG